MTQQNERGTEPDIESIARRAIGLARFTQRAQMEMAATQAGNPGIQARMSEMMAPFIQSTLTGGQAECLSREERWLFEQPPASWPSEDIVQALWRVEALGVLLWSLSLMYAIPAYDHLFDIEEVQARVQDLATPGDLILRGTLRPAAEVEAARRVAELWHWRASVAGVRPEPGDLPLGLTYKDMAAFNASAAYERGEIPAPIDGDFPITGKAYADLSPEDLTYAGGIARQRHFALNWLCGYGKTWDETSTET